MDRPTCKIGRCTYINRMHAYQNHRRAYQNHRRAYQNHRLTYQNHRLTYQNQLASVPIGSLDAVLNPPDCALILLLVYAFTTDSHKLFSQITQTLYLEQSVHQSVLICG